jgi:GNAT superfamily N-acetyltransferase
LGPVSDDIHIENASIEDLPRLADLLDDLFSQEKDFVPNREKQLHGLRLILEQPSRGRIFVARGPSSIIGMINLLITISTAEGGFVLVLEDLIIHRDHRGQGYGSRLLEKAVSFAKEKNFLRITLLTDRPNHAVRRFYQARGFVESAMIPMRLYLDRHGA